MTPSQNTMARANLIGSLWMITAMAAFAIEDSLIKAAAQDLPIGQILILFGIGGAVLFALIAMVQGQPLFTSDVISRPMIIRVGFEITGRLFYFLAIALIPLSTATVILQATPLVVVLGAVIVFGERVGWRRWVAIALGFVGVIIIVQPGTSGFSALSILALIGMLGFAGRDLASRVAPKTISTTLLGLYGFCSVIVAGVIYSGWSKQAFFMPSNDSALILIGAIVIGIGAYSCLMKAMRTGEVSAVTPFRYSRLLFGILMGVLLFQETITWPMIVGSCLIVASGVFIIWRSRTHA